MEEVYNPYIDIDIWMEANNKEWPPLKVTCYGQCTCCNDIHLEFAQAIRDTGYPGYIPGLIDVPQSIGV